MTKKAPNPIDKHVGSRVRMRRMMIGMSQEKLGEKLGITFQQIQKYEKGTNRVGASRLQQIATSLSVPPSFFFEGAPVPDGADINEKAMANENMAIKMLIIPFCAYWVQIFTTSFDVSVLADVLAFSSRLMCFLMYSTAR